MIVLLAKVIGALIIGCLPFIRRDGFANALITSGYAYIICWLLAGLLYFCAYLAELLLGFVGVDVHWTGHVSNNIWIIQAVFFAFAIIVLLSGSNKKRKSDVGKTTVSATPVSKPKKAVGLSVVANRNLTNIASEIRRGVNVKLDFRTYSLTDITKLVELSGKSGAKVTLNNVKGVQADILSNIAKLSRGRVILDLTVKADFDAVRLAKSGACFICDCKNKSNLIIDVASGAKEGNGCVRFINTNWMSISELDKLRKAGGDNIEIG